MQVQIKIKQNDEDRLLLDIDLATLALAYMCGTIGQPRFLPLEEMIITLDGKALPWPDWTQERD